MQKGIVMFSDGEFDDNSIKNLVRANELKEYVLEYCMFFYDDLEELDGKQVRSLFEVENV